MEQLDSRESRTERPVKRIALVLTYGRSGSTLLMGALAAHPLITVRRKFPYEARGSQYFFACARRARNDIDLQPILYHGVNYVICRDSDTQLKDATSEFLGAIPGNDGRYLAADYHAIVAALEEKSGSEVIAEKAIGLRLAKEIYEVWPNSRVVVLVRDPRDIFFSIKSFNAKRGALSFGEEHGQEFLFESIIHFYKQAQEDFLKGGVRACATHYEDLLRAPRNEIERLLDFLNLEINEKILLDASEAVRDRDADVLEHSTSTSALSSVGRWREEASDEHRNLFMRFLPDIRLLSRLGGRETI